MTRAAEVLREIEGMTATQFLPIVGPKKGMVLVDAIHEIKPKRILEVGTFIGYSAITMGKELDGDATITTIEIHKDEAERARENIRRAEIKPRVEVVVGDALDVIPTLEGPFDLVFIDAEKSEYIDYLKLVEGKLHPGSMIVADNAGIFADQMREYLEYVRNSGKYRSRFVAMGGDGLEVSVKI